MKELLVEYLEIIKNVQEYEGEGGFPIYSLNQERVRLHRKIADYLDIKSEMEYLKLKEIFANMDLICGLYSECEEWKLENHTDVVLMANDLYKFLTSAEAKMFIQGDVKELKHLPCFQR